MEQDIKMLQQQVKGLNNALLGIIIALSDDKDKTKHVIDTLLLMDKYTAVTESDAASLPIKWLNDKLSACHDYPSHSLEPLLVQMLQYAQTPEERRAALHTWQAQATVDELSDDLQAFFSQINDKP